MSELIKTQEDRTCFQSKLLTTVSALALTAHIASSNAARAEDVDRPTVWIEVGGQMDRMQGLSDPFSAPFMTAKTPTPDPYSGDIFVEGQKAPRNAFGFDGKLIFQPEDSDWSISASIRYGRSNTKRHIHQQSPTPVPTVLGQVRPTRFINAAAFADIKTPYGERHAIIDFNVGKDVGLGMLGHEGSSQLSVGVRSADLSSDEDLSIHARPEIIIKRLAGVPMGLPEASFHGYTMTAFADRSFRGTGPSLGWNASAALVGDRRDGEITLDWSITGSLLFGRQKAQTDHKTHSYKFGTLAPKYQNYAFVYDHHTPSGSVRSRSVTVPNVGGTLGFSVKYPNAKVSVGYRADFFFGAMDTGIDERHTKDLGFSGPYATISIGLGG